MTREAHSGLIPSSILPFSCHWLLNNIHKSLLVPLTTSSYVENYPLLALIVGSRTWIESSPSFDPFRSNPHSVIPHGTNLSCLTNSSQIIDDDDDEQLCVIIVHRQGSFGRNRLRMDDGQRGSPEMVSNRNPLYIDQFPLSLFNFAL